MKLFSRWLCAPSRSQKHRQSHFRKALLEQFERRDLMAFSVNNFHLVNDNGISSTDKITSDPTVAGNVVSGPTGGPSGGSSGMAGSGYANVEFDHNGDGIVDGVAVTTGVARDFNYDPRISNPSLAVYVGAFTLNYRTKEFDSLGSQVAVGAWTAFPMTLTQAASGEISVVDSTFQNVISGTSTIDLGTVFVGAAVSRSFTISNLASSVLRLDNQNVQIPSGFTLSQSFAATVNANAQTTFTLTANTATAGLKQGTVSFATSDSDENPFNFIIKVNVVAPAPEIDVKNAQNQTILDNTGSLAFGSTILATPVSQTITILNSGQVALTIDPATLQLPAGFSLVGTYQTSIAPNTSTTMTVRMTAATVGSFSGQLSFGNNDGDENPYNFNLTGTVTAGAPIAIDNLRLLSNDGVSATDRISSNPTVTGSVSGNFQNGSVIVEFDHNGDGVANGSVTVATSGGNFTYDPRSTDNTLVGFTGRLPLRTRTIHKDSNNNVIATSSWSNFDVIIDGTASTGGLTVNSFGLQRDTGDSTIDRVTISPVLQATVTGDFAGGSAKIEFDHQGNGTVGATVTVSSPGSIVTYDPRLGDPSLIAFVGDTSLRYRLVKLSPAGAVVSTSSWITFAYTLAAAPSSNFKVQQYQLLHDDGTSTTDKVTSDPTLTATIVDTSATNVQSTAYALVQFDTTGDEIPESTTATSALGEVSFRPEIPYGLRTVRARALQWDVSYATYLVGTWESIQIHFVAAPAPQATNLRLAADTGLSDTDKITDNPAVVGQVQRDGSQVPDCLVYFDVDGNGQPDGSAITDRDGNFLIRPSTVSAGAVTYRIFSAYFDTVSQSTVYGAISEFSFTYAPAAISTIDWIDLAVDDGVDPLDRATSNPLLVGQLSTQAIFSNVLLEFDHNGDNTPDGFSQSDQAGAFMYLPVGITAGVFSPRGRTKQWNSNTSSWQFSDWKSLSFTYVVSATASVNVTQLGLRVDTGVSASDNITSESTLVGTITGTASLAGQLIDFDENNDGVVDGKAVTDAQGKFQYVPDNLAAGAHTVRARTRTWNTAQQQGVLGTWLGFTYTVAADTNSAPTIGGFALWSDSGASATDNLTENPMLTGTVSNPGGSLRMLIELDSNSDGIADSVTYSDDAGRFYAVPVISGFGSKTVKARAKEFDASSGSLIPSSWVSLTFTYQDQAAAAPVLSGVSWNPISTSTSQPTVSGRVLDDESVASVGIEIDRNSDGTADDLITTDWFGNFLYLPTNTPTGSVSMKIRTRETDLVTNVDRVGSWTTFNFSNPAPVANTAPIVVGLGLVHDDGVSSTDRISTDLTLQGTVTNEQGVAGLLVQVDHNGDGIPDGTTVTDTDGRFQYLASGLVPGAYTLQVRAKEYDATSGVVLGNWASLSATLAMSTTSKIGSFTIVSDTGSSATDGATANPAVRGTISGSSTANVLIFFDQNGDGTPDGNATSDSTGAFSFTPQGLTEGLVQINAWIARGGSPGDSNSSAVRYVYAAAPDGAAAQAKVAQLTSFNSLWQSAQGALSAAITAADTAARTAHVTAENNYNTALITAATALQSGNASAESAYKTAKAAAESSYAATMATAQSTFATSLAAFSDKRVGALPQFIWPTMPPADEFVVPSAESQPAVPKVLGLEEGPRLDLTQDRIYSQLIATANSSATAATGTASASYQATRTNANNVATAANATAFSQYAAGVATANQTYANAVRGATHPTIDPANEARLDAGRRQTAKDTFNASKLTAEQTYDAAVSAAQAAQTTATNAANTTYQAAYNAAWQKYYSDLAANQYTNPGIGPQLVATRDRSIGDAITIRDSAIADALQAASKSIASALEIKTNSIADAQRILDRAVADSVKVVRDLFAVLAQWKRDWEIGLAYTRDVGLAGEVETRAQREADAAYQRSVTLIQAAYDEAVARANAAQNHDGATSIARLNALNGFASFMGSPAAQLDAANAQTDSTIDAQQAQAQKDAELAAALASRDEALGDALAAKDFSYSVAFHAKTEAVAEAKEKRDLRYGASLAKKGEDLADSVSELDRDYANATTQWTKATSLSFAVKTQTYGTADQTRARAGKIAIADGDYYANHDGVARATATANATYDYDVGMSTVNRVFTAASSQATKDQTQGLAVNSASFEKGKHANLKAAQAIVAAKINTHDTNLSLALASQETLDTGSSVTFSNAVATLFQTASNTITTLEKTLNDTIASLELDRVVGKASSLKTITTQTANSQATRVATWHSALNSPWSTFQNSSQIAKKDLVVAKALAEFNLTQGSGAAELGLALIENGLAKSLAMSQVNGSVGLLGTDNSALQLYVSQSNDSIHLFNDTATNKTETFMNGVASADALQKDITSDGVAAKTTSQAEADRIYALRVAQADELLAPDFGAAKRDLSIAQSKFDLGVISASALAAAQTAYNTAMNLANATYNARINDAVTEKRGIEGEGIKQLEISGALARQAFANGSGTAYAGWVSEVGTEQKLLAGNLKPKGVTFASTVNSAAATAVGGDAAAIETYILGDASGIQALNGTLASQAAIFNTAINSAESSANSALATSEADYHLTLYTGHAAKKEAQYTAAPSSLTNYQRQVAQADVARSTSRKTAQVARAATATLDHATLTTALNLADTTLVTTLAAADQAQTVTAAGAQRSKTGGYASAQAAEITGGVTADLENARADVDASVLASGTMAGARVTAANSIALADLVFATARGEALKQKHIAGDTTAATQTADAAIAAAKVVYDNAVISANVIAAGTIGDAAIQLASDTGTNAKTAVDTWGSLASTLVGATNLLESSFTTGLNSAYATWTAGSVTAQMSSLLASGQAQQALIAADGLANATWMAAMGSADVAKATAKTTAENGFVQAEITRIGTNPATMVSLIGSSSIASSFTGLGSDTSAAQSWIDWATAYAPARLAESTATAQATAALASDRWLAESVLNNAQASADIAWIGNLALPVLAKANGDATASNALDSSLVSDGSSLLSGLTTAVATRGSAGAQSVKLQAVDEATALKNYLVALAGLAPGASTTVAKKAYDDALAIARRDDKVRQADAEKTNALSQVVSARTFVGSLGSDVKGYRDSLAGSEYVETMAFAPLLATRNQAYDGAEAGKLLALTTAENTWRSSTATAWANRTGSDFSARATALAGLSTRAGTVFHASQSAIESARSGWWTSHKPAYLQWNIDVNTAESSFTQSLATAKTTLSAALNTAALAFASTDALAIKTHDLALSLVDQTYTTEIANANQTYANAKSTADRDLTVALAIAESNLAVSGDQSAYGTAVNAANAAYATAIDSATTIRDTAKQAAKDKRADDSSLVNKTLADDETLAEKTYDLAESAARSAETHTQALARKTRQTNIAALDSAYATLRDQSWSTSLATATSTRTDPWTVQARQQATAKATRTASVSTATSTHDAALASYLADWTNSSIDAKTLAINARATAIATSSGAKNLANYNFGTNAPVSIGGITENIIPANFTNEFVFVAANVADAHFGSEVEFTEIAAAFSPLTDPEKPKDPAARSRRYREDFLKSMRNLFSSDSAEDMEVRKFLDWLTKHPDDWQVHHKLMQFNRTDLWPEFFYQMEGRNVDALEGLALVPKGPHPEITEKQLKFWDAKKKEHGVKNIDGLIRELTEEQKKEVWEEWKKYSADIDQFHNDILIPLEKEVALEKLNKLKQEFGVKSLEEIANETSTPKWRLGKIARDGEWHKKLGTATGILGVLWNGTSALANINHMADLNTDQGQRMLTLTDRYERLLKRDIDGTAPTQRDWQDFADALRPVLIDALGDDSKVETIMRIFKNHLAVTLGIHLL